MGMLRVDLVADHEVGLWSAARDNHGAWLRPKNRGQTQKSHKTTEQTSHSPRYPDASTNTRYK